MRSLPERSCWHHENSSHSHARLPVASLKPRGCCCMRFNLRLFQSPATGTSIAYAHSGGGIPVPESRPLGLQQPLQSFGAVNIE